MPIEITLKDIGPKLASGGVLDPDQVLVRFRTQEDDRVRPSHAALEGKVFRLDDPGRPSPPLDWGCRCFLEDVAAPDTVASQVLAEEAQSPPTTPPAAYADYLDEEIGRAVWTRIAKATALLPPARRLHTALSLLLRALAKDRRADARDLARMIVEAESADMDQPTISVLKTLDRAQAAIWTSLDAACRAYATGLRGKPLVDRHFTAGNAARYGFAPLSRDYFNAKKSGIVSSKGGKHFLPPKLQAAIAALPKGKRKLAIAHALGARSGSKLDQAAGFQSSTGQMRGFGAAANLPMLVLTGDTRRSVGAKTATIRINRSSGVCIITFRNLTPQAKWLHEGTAKMPARSPVEPCAADIVQMRAIAQQFYNDAVGRARANPATKRR